MHTDTCISSYNVTRAIEKCLAFEYERKVVAFLFYAVFSFSKKFSLKNCTRSLMGMHTSVACRREY